MNDPWTPCDNFTTSELEFHEFYLTLWTLHDTNETCFVFLIWPVSNLIHYKSLDDMSMFLCHKVHRTNMIHITSKELPINYKQLWNMKGTGKAYVNAFTLYANSKVF